MLIDAKDISIGYIIRYNDELFKILDKSHVQPGKGGAFYKYSVKNLDKGYKKDISVKSGDKVYHLKVATKDCTVLYTTENFVTILINDMEEIDIPIEKSTKDIIDNKLLNGDNTSLSIVMSDDGDIIDLIP